MINKVNFTTPSYNNRMAFQGEKEVKMLVEKIEELPQCSDAVTNLNFDLRMMVKRKKVTIEDIEKAFDSFKDTWKYNLSKPFIKKD